MARHGEVSRGLEWPGEARFGGAGPGLVGHGEVRQGVAPNGLRQFDSAGGSK